MIADLHCHYSSHLIADEPDPGGPDEGWLRQILDKAEGEIVDLVARLVGNSSSSSGWRVKSVEGLESGGAGIVCSVLLADLGVRLPAPE
jgi:hypothetical protein